MSSTLHDETLTSPADQCPSCGRPLESGWTFCGRCGGALAVAVPDGAAGRVVEETHAPSAADMTGEMAGDLDGDDAGATSSRGPLRRAVLPLVAAALAVGIAVVAAVGWAKFQSTSEELSVTRSTLRVASAELVETSDALDDTRRILTSTEDDLEISEGDLERVRSELRRTEGSLSSAQSRMDLQANQIATLRTCLDGVSNALSYAAYSQYGQAVAELNAVEVACDKAYDVL